MISYRTVIFGMLSLITLLVIMLVGYTSYQQSYQKIELLIGERLQSIATTATLSLNAKDHKKIFKKFFKGENQIHLSPEFLRFQSRLKRIKDKNNLKQDIYTVKLNPLNKEEMIFVTMSADETYIGNVMTAHPMVKVVYETKKAVRTSIYQDEEGSWISGFAPIIDKKDRVVGVLEVDYDLHEEIKTIKTELVKFIAIPAILIMFGISILAFFLSRNVTRPLEILVKKVRELEKGSQDNNMVVKTKFKEFRSLHDNFDAMAETILVAREKLQDYAENLEQKVEIKTRELSESKKNVENILNNLSQGFFTFHASGEIGSEYSVVVNQMFEGLTDGSRFNELVKISSEDFSDWLGLAFSGTLEFDSLVGLLPSSFINHANRFIELDYRPIFLESGQLKEVIVISADKTEEIQFKEESVKQREFSKFVVHLIESPDIFSEYCASFTDYVDRSLKIVAHGNMSDAASCEELSRYIHTLKGESSYNHIYENVSFANQIEDEIKDIAIDNSASLKRIQSLLIEMQQKFKEFLKEHQNLIDSGDNQALYVKRSRSEISQLFQKFKADETWIGIKEELHRYFLLDGAEEVFRRYAAHVTELASKQNKRVDFKIKSHDARLDSSKLNPFIKSCIHLIRNAVDHGIEPPSKREAMGKNTTAKLVVDVKENNDGLVFQFRDDGRGIDHELVKQTAIDKNFVDSKGIVKINDGEWINFIFQPGFSTKDRVTLISGRGVGLDAVKAEVEQLGGSISVTAQKNVETCFNIKIPK